LALVAAGAVLVAGAALLALPPANRPLAAASLIVSLSAVFLFAYMSRWLAAGDDGIWTRPSEESTDLQSLPHAPELLVAQQTLTHYIRELGRHSDEILREAAMLKLVSIQDEVRALAAGKVGFSATEGWRTLYERLLRSPDVQSYRSVAWVRSEDYWRDAPGQRSMQLNFEILRSGVAIERILILNDFFWPPAALLPSADISRWIDEQHEGGVQVSLVRESEIESEPDMLCDLGIYGNRATGWLELDTQCRTSRFTFDFSQESLQIADERWKRLSLYAVPFAELLERTERAG
jgi:hypothetical protein